MSRNNATLRLDEEVDEYLDKKSEEWDTNRSEIVNRALKVYAAKVAKGEWRDPKFSDKYDETMEKI